MSFREQVEQVGGNHYVLPKVGAMRTEVHAYLSPALFEGTKEDTWRQAADSASYEGATGCFLMPDTHPGYGLPVGGVLVTDGVIVQSGSGYDISCGVLYMKTTLTAEDVADWDKRLAWVREVEKHIATGMGSHRPRHAQRFTYRDAEKLVRYGVKAMGINADRCERPCIPIPEDLDLSRIERAWNKVADQMGSVGGGNHFIEMQVDQSTGEVGIMVHCGSRGYGWQIANHYFYAGAELRGLPKNRREQSWLYADEPLGREYWAYHNAAANFAVANRWSIVHGLRQALDAIWGAEGEVWYEISHNLVQEETLLLPDGATQKGFVHRKGATRAFPAGHPDLAGTRWETTGHPCLIPGSMLTGAAILFPLAGAYASGCSVNHGSGRLLGRGQAKTELACLHDEIDTEMRTIQRTFNGVTIKGIVGNTERTPLDECGHAYKDLDTVLQVLDAEGIARVTNRMAPVASIKGAD